ncbi:MAG: ATP-binding protein [Thermoleophilia bacterium]|nr:ATP-binding protein [Thermoleophilia bacterium]
MTESIDIPPTRICVIGAESTGKTTLCSDLARRYGVPFVPEFGRHYTEALPDAQRYTWQRHDFVVIAQAQNHIENDAMGWIRPLVICDTNSFVTSVFCEAYLGERDAEVDALAAGREYDLYVVCDPTTPFEQDLTTGLRRDGSQRTWMHERYLEYLAETHTPWLMAKGTRDERVELVVAVLTEQQAANSLAVLAD